jgi:AMMECR1 domain-containing protein
VSPSGSPVPALARRLPPASRAALAKQLRALLSGQHDLATWPRPFGVGHAVPFVSLYSSRGLRGCAGAPGGEPSTRVARAFLAAMHDARFPVLTPAEQLELRAEVSFLRAPREVTLTEWNETFEAGTHGAALVSPGAATALLLPEIALARRATATKFLAALREKSARVAAPSDRLFRFETERVVVYEHAFPKANANDTAAAWLSGMITPSGEVFFEVDGTTAVGDGIGEMHHARISIALAALAAHGGFETRRKRALRRLASDIGNALAGRDVPGWPRGRAHVAGTLALASLAGVPLHEELRGAAAWPALHENGWHAAQVALALGRDAPAALWKACVRALEREPWAPWTAMAARARGDVAVLERALPPLVDSVRAAAPHAGGVCMPGQRPGAVPELALTAVVVEALSPSASRSRAVARAILDARRFLRRWQCLPEQAPGSIDLRTALGAFPGSPIHAGLRVDVTGHALLALLGAE